MNPLRHAGLRPIVTTLTLAFALAAPARAATDVHVRGLLDLTLGSGGRGATLNQLDAGDSPFDPDRLRLTAEGALAPGLDVSVQGLVESRYEASLYGAYVTWTPAPARDLHVVAGRMPWLVGTYAARAYPDRSPLIGAPLIEHYHTGFASNRMPRDADALLRTAGTGEYATGYSGGVHAGMPVVDDARWSVGAGLVGSARPFEFALGVTTGPPSAPERVAGSDARGALQARVGWLPWPGLRLGVSGATGPYLAAAVDSFVPAGKHPRDYRQSLVMADAEVDAGHLEVRAEGAADTWSTPTVGNLGARGGYVEGRLALPAGTFAAGRWDALRFSKVLGSDGREPWDYDLDRLETGLGYRWDRDVTLKAVFQRTWTYDGDAVQRDDLWALQLVVGF